MTEVCLVGCTKSKRDRPADARDLYDESALFRKRRRIARRRGAWWILSAEHGLVHPDRALRPYDTHINDRDSEQWAEEVLNYLLPVLDDADATAVRIYAGSSYVDPLVPSLEQHGYDVIDPGRGLRPGERMSRLDEVAEETEQQELVTDGGSEHKTTLVENIREVWGDHDDFEEGGLPYVAFLIRQDVGDMEADEWDEQECVEELADVCINAMRMLDERGYFPSQVITNRLDDHEMKGTDQLVSKYQERFNNRSVDTESARSGGDE